MIRFYAPEIEETSVLADADSAHCCRVLRMRAGDEIEVVDGKGCLYKCIIKDADPRATAVDVISKENLERHWSPLITLAIAPTKNIDRIEWLVEKAVEIGVDKIAFVNCRNSVRKIIKLDRLQKIMISAMKQSLKATLPVIEEMTDFKSFVTNDRSEVKYIGYCSDLLPRKEFVKEYDGTRDLTILIGPEGDFSAEEVTLAIDSGYDAVTFGNARLRTETAALYGLCAAHVKMSMV